MLKHNIIHCIMIEEKRLVTVNNRVDAIEINNYVIALDKEGGIPDIFGHKCLKFIFCISSVCLSNMVFYFVHVRPIRVINAMQSDGDLIARFKVFNRSSAFPFLQRMTRKKRKVLFIIFY